MPFKRKDRGFPVRTLAYKYRVFPEYGKKDFEPELKNQIFDEARLMHELWNELLQIRSETLDKISELFDRAIIELKAEEPELFEKIIAENKKPRTVKKTAKVSVSDQAAEADKVRLKSSVLKKYSKLYAEGGERIWTEYQERLTNHLKNPDVRSKYAPDVREDIWNRYQAAHDRALKNGGSLEIKPTFIKQFRFNHRFSGGGIAPAKLQGTSKKIWLDLPDSDLFRDEKYRMRKNRVCSGRFGIGVADHLQVPFRAVIHRKIPDTAFIKNVALCGRSSPRGWIYYLIISVDEPEINLPPATTHIAGIDLGWRKFENYIRFGMICDTKGNLFELRLPTAPITTAPERRLEKLFAKHGNQLQSRPRTFEDLNEWKRLRDESKDLVKNGLKTMVLPKTPEITRLFSNLTKCGRQGLVKLLRLLENLPDEEQNADGKKAIELLREFETEYKRRLEAETKTRNKLINRRENNYRNVVAWLRRNYAHVVYEKDLDLKEMASEAAEATITTAEGAALKNSAKYRTYVALSELVGYLTETKPDGWLDGVEGKDTTGKCNICGASVEVSQKLNLVCANNHKFDQDANAGANIRDKTSFKTKQSGELQPIPENLRKIIVPFHN